MMKLTPICGDIEYSGDSRQPASPARAAPMPKLTM